ncbi:putative RNA methyltransferase [Listeria costaricensis]|uniref:putative RNA methyltransferase n=1 Tax=Listeria costaricensis TaxID=2026604 RepID=UPI0013C435AA|nr:methyltransferase domain-containing protein [Listeria costaricensis]
MESKLAVNLRAIGRILPQLACPHCGGHLALEGASLLCEAGHRFDVAKPGYLFLLDHGIHTKYDRQLFEARKRISDAGFFAPLTEKLAELCATYLDGRTEGLLVDAGTGEGSHLAEISRQLGGGYPVVGLDIAKEGIRQAARDYPGHAWITADLAACPLQDDSTALLLNILSPASYQEFDRILKSDGLLIKVFPEKDYLQEIRTAFALKESGGHAVVYERLLEEYTVIEEATLHYQKALSAERFRDLLLMTPLGWHLEAAQVDQFLQTDLPQVTVGYRVVVARRKA